MSSDHASVGSAQLWWDERGHGPTVALLHGGFGDSRDFDGNLHALADTFRVVRHDRRGQGRSPDPGGPITQHLMAQDAAALLERVAAGPVHVVGYSDGAVVALLLALRRPDLVDKLVLVSGVHDRSGWLVAPEPDSPVEMPEEVVDAYAEVSPDGRDHFPVLAGKLAAYSAEDLGVTAEDLATLGHRVLVVVADDDIVDLGHTLTTYRSLPAGELAVVPGTSHGLLQDKPELCTTIIRAFLDGPAVPTCIPLRRPSA